MVSYLTSRPIKTPTCTQSKGILETPSWIAFARENGTVYHTYMVSAPDPFVAPCCSFVQERTPRAPRTPNRDPCAADAGVGPGRLPCDAESSSA